MSSAGDFDNDGVDDILVGAPEASRLGRSGNGAAYLLYGQANGFTQHIDLNIALPNSSGFEMIGGMDGDKFGYFVNLAGNMNFDGVNDIMVAAYGVDHSGLSTVGAVYIVYSHDLPPCSAPNCISCLGSKCLACKLNYLLYLGDNKCYFKDSCPLGTSPSFTHCVDELLESVGTTQALASKSAALVASAITLVSFSNPLGLLFAALGESLLYMKYMNINYPPKLQYILNQPEASLYTIQYISSAAEEIEDGVEKVPLADNFERNDLHSSFLINFWSSLMTLLIIVTAIIIVWLSAYLTQSCQSIRIAIGKVKESLKWNYLIATFAGSYGPIAFFSSFEFRTVQFGSSLEILSFALCILMNIILVGISVKIFMIIKTLTKEKNSKKLKRLKRRFRDYEVVFENFKGSSFSQQSYFLLSCLRFYLFYTILGYLFEYPLTQAVLINIQGIFFLGYICLKQPFQSKFEFVETLIIEFTFQIIHACVLGLAIADEKGSETSIRTVNLGVVMMICICVFVGAQCIYLIIHTIALIVTLFKFFKSTYGEKPERRSGPRRNPAKTPSLRDPSIDKDIIDQSQVLTMPQAAKKRNLLRPLPPAVLAPRSEMSSGAYVEDNEMRNSKNIDVQYRQNGKRTWGIQVTSSERKSAMANRQNRNAQTSSLNNRNYASNESKTITTNKMLQSKKV